MFTTFTVTLLPTPRPNYSVNVCISRISLIRNCEKLPAQEHLIVQEYLDKPFLMEGYKFDLRVYILVTSCDPLRIFLYKDGLVRMGTEKYHAPTEANLVSHWEITARMNCGKLFIRQRRFTALYV